MGIADYKYWLKAASGQSNPVNELNGSQTLSGGTQSLIDLGGGEYAWEFSGSDSTGSTDSATITNATGQGITLAVRFAVTSNMTTNDAIMFRWNGSGSTDYGWGVGRNFNSNTECGGGTTAATLTRMTYPFCPMGTTYRTAVCRLKRYTDETRDHAIWWSGGGGTSAADGVDNGAYYGGHSISLATLRVAPTGGTFRVKDIVLWSEQLTDQQCRDLATDLRGTLSAGSGSATGAAMAYLSQL